MVNGISALLMGAITACLLLVESPFQGSESHRRAAGGHLSPRRAGSGAGEGLAHHSPKGWSLGTAESSPPSLPVRAGEFHSSQCSFSRNVFSTRSEGAVKPNCRLGSNLLSLPAGHRRAGAPVADSPHRARVHGAEAGPRHQALPPD